MKKILIITVTLLFIVIIIYNNSPHRNIITKTYVQELIGVDKEILNYREYDNLLTVFFRNSQNNLGFSIYKENMLGKHNLVQSSNQFKNLFKGTLTRINKKYYLLIVGIKKNAEQLNLEYYRLNEPTLSNSFNFQLQDDYYIIIKEIKDRITAHVELEQFYTFYDEQGNDITSKFIDE
ncbi:hypothetical protein EZV73_27030 [Acidaminobacter sp. JC074]|uniref:hypothetical protein n=1 Tax=Acidaminobacter sp. JC074 TaxID=2530199 RepID=UPI001F1105BF|nr:hypothetical protein [Acidaminobacter sp. JC074]MCH4891253.1 hypothetical protein [Acidaminobacter sp. JC074]